MGRFMGRGARGRPAGAGLEGKGAEGAANSAARLGGTGEGRRGCSIADWRYASNICRRWAQTRPCEHRRQRIIRCRGAERPILAYGSGRSQPHIGIFDPAGETP